MQLSVMALNLGNICQQLFIWLFRAEVLLDQVFRLHGLRIDFCQSLRTSVHMQPAVLPHRSRDPMDSSFDSTLAQRQLHPRHTVVVVQGCPSRICCIATERTSSRSGLPVFFQKR